MIQCYICNIGRNSQENAAKYGEWWGFDYFYLYHLYVINSRIYMGLKMMRSLQQRHDVCLLKAYKETNIGCIAKISISSERSWKNLSSEYQYSRNATCTNGLILWRKTMVNYPDISESTQKKPPDKRGTRHRSKVK